MSGGSLPRTGSGAIALGGTIAGVSLEASVPMPLIVAAVGVTLVLAGALLIRLGFRRRRPAGAS
jgi:UDP-N-acetylmuramyl pentapeptide phosphotransferase/UDP-N-acetylglucosamine-1-phosphate transferase